MKLRDETRRFRDHLCAQYLSQTQGILHLGAHLGQEAGEYAKRNKQVLWVEAMPDIHARLEKSLEKYPNQRSLCALLGDVDGVSRTFHVSNNWEGVSSSLFRFGPYASGDTALWPELHLQMVKEITLPMVTLDTLLKNHGVDAADYSYWVVDLQGAEKLALQGAAGALSSCAALYTEVSRSEVYENGVLWSELRDFLEAAGFMPLWEPELDHDDVLFVRAGQKHKARKTFQSEHYLRHNQRRLEHLASLQLDVHGKTVLEVGAGIGDHTGFYLDRGCKVTVTDVRPENLAFLRDRFSGNPAVTFQGLDLDHPIDLAQQFDVIHCYGILYHLERPAEALQYLARHCRSLLLLETCVSRGNELLINPVDEPTEQFSQAFYGRGCRPTRPWVWARLKELMPYVYATATQPAHEEFPLDWTAGMSQKAVTLTRAVFVASRIDLGANPNLLNFLPDRQLRTKTG